MLAVVYCSKAARDELRIACIDGRAMHEACCCTLQKIYDDVVHNHVQCKISKENMASTPRPSYEDGFISFAFKILFAAR